MPQQSPESEVDSRATMILGHNRPRVRSLLFLVCSWSLSAAALAQPAAGPSLSGQEDQAGKLTTVAWAALTSYDSLLDDIGFLGELAGRPGTADMIRGMIPMFTQGRDVAGMGLDTTRPVGVVLRTDGVQFVPIVCLPITDLDATLEVVEGFGFAPADAGDGVVELELPDQTLYLKSSGEWTYAAQSPDALDSAPNDPSPALNMLVRDYDLSVKLAVQNVPELYRQMALQQLRAGMEQGLVQQDNESDEDFEARSRLAEIQVQQISDMIEGFDRLTLGWNLDAAAQSTHLDVVLTVLPDSKLAPAMAVYNDATTRLAGFHKPDAALSMLGMGTTPPEMLEEQREQIEATVATFRTQVAKAADSSDEIPNDQMREDLKAIAFDLLDAYEEMLMSGKAEFGGSLELSDDGYAAVAAAKLPDPKKVEAAARKLGRLAEEYDTGGVQPKFEFDLGSHAGVEMHRLTVPIPDEKQARVIFGEELIVTVGIGPDAVYLAAGPKGEDALKAAIDESRSRDGEKILPFEGVASVKQFVNAFRPLANAQNEMVFAMLSDAFEEAEPGTDRLRISGRGVENGVLIRYEAEAGVLRAFGKAAMAAQQQAMGGGGF